VTYPGRRAPTGEPDWLTLGQAAKFLGVAQSTIRKWSDQGRVPAFYTPGGHRRYRRGDLDNFLERSGPSGGSGPTVLIVDDDAKLREYVRVNLEMEGYSVKEAGSADEGLGVLDESTPDLVLLDVMMPIRDGFEVCQKLRATGQTKLKIILLTAKGRETEVAKGLAVGADAYVTKPFSTRDLVEQVTRLLDDSGGHVP
jgi:excisionase family DNA binding protein